MSGPRKFEARYPGRCVVCQERIEVGEDLVMEEEQAVHFGCAGRASQPARRLTEVCPRCFTEKSLTGVCGCEES